MKETNLGDVCNTEKIMQLPINSQVATRAKPTL